MTRTFWLGVGCGVLATALVAFTVLPPDSQPAPGSPAPVPASPPQRASSPAADEHREDSSATKPELGELLRSGLGAATGALNAAFADGSISGLELMQLAADNPGLIVAGVNDYALADPFRLALIDTVTRLKDPLGTIACLDVDREPNQDMSSRIAGVLAGLVDRGSVADGRAVPVIKKLLAGNPMRGEKNNLYPVLAQLAAQGEQAARALVRGADVGAFSPGLATLLDPPARDELGRDLSGAVVYSLQSNKGRWSDRPAQLSSGDTVVSMGGHRVTSAAAFFEAIRKHHKLGGNDLVDAGVFRPTAQAPRRYEFSTVRLDTGDLQLVYGAYTVKRR